MIRKPVALALLALLAVAAAPVSADADYALDFASAYVWRGITFTDGAVWQPSVTASNDSGFAINVWGNLDLDDANDMSAEFNEIDLTASYGFGTDAVSAEVGFIEYLFPNTAFAGTREVYLTLGLDITASPSLSVYYDIDEVKDFYANFGVSFGGDVSDAMAWSVDVSAGWAGDDFAAAYGGTSGGMYDGNVTFGLSGGAWSAFVSYVDALDDDALPEQPVDFLAGIGFSF
ncbi:MAG: MltA-interacting MipA family protein [Acidobacteria bacterium]|nr:MltA-interacting MipA family protein [Acidobacteriota bacterium]